MVVKNIKPGAYSIPAFDVVNSIFKENPEWFTLGETSTSGYSNVAKTTSCSLTSPGEVKLPSANNISSNRVSVVGQGNASGLAIQVLVGLNPVQFGPLLTGSNLNRIGRVGTGGGNLTMQLTARYKHIAAKMTPGLIKTGVLVNLVYE